MLIVIFGIYAYGVKASVFEASVGEQVTDSRQTRLVNEAAGHITEDK